MENQLTRFRRLNFFTGFYTTAEDWNDGEHYHIEKRKLHNRALHRPGILAGIGEELAVLPAGARRVTVQPGAALDGHGNLLLIDAPQSITIAPGAGAAQTAYITIEFAEQDDSYEEDPDFGGYKRKLEAPIVGYRFDRPDGVTQLELARVALAVDVAEITAPDNPDAPPANTIDRRYAHRAGARDPYFAAIAARVAGLFAALEARQRRHNLGLHTPGVFHLVAQELTVTPVGGLTLCVAPGAALDGQGNELYLDEATHLTLVAAPDVETVHYVAASYCAPNDSALLDLTQPFVVRSGTASVTLSSAKPDGVAQVELARIALAPGATVVTVAHNPDRPGPNEIDLRGRRWSAARELSPLRLDAVTQQWVDTLMGDARENFAALAVRFPVPSLGDVRIAALQVRLMVGAIEPEQLPRTLHVLADLEVDVGEELGAHFPPLLPKAEFDAYQQAVAALHTAIDERHRLDAILTAQAVVNSAVYDLAQVNFAPPIAAAGPDRTVETPDYAAPVELDGSASQAASGQRIVKYIWKEAEA